MTLLGTRRFRGEGLFVLDEPELGEHGIRPTTWDDLDVVMHHRSFLAEPRRYLRHVLGDIED